MRYIGGKARQARRIVDAMLDLRDGRTSYLEPFLGGASVAALAAPHFDDVTLADAHPDIAPLWRWVRDGWVPPADLTRDEYETLRAKPQPSALRGWAGFAASYNGKYFGGYGPTAPTAGRDYLDEAARAALRKAPGLDGAEIIEADYREHNPGPDTVVYCDPPYAGTMPYAGTDPFDTVAFWRTVTGWAAAGALVLVSEYEAPAGWRSALDTDRTATVHHAGSVAKRREGLFVFHGEDPRP